MAILKITTKDDHTNIVVLNQKKIQINLKTIKELVFYSFVKKKTFFVFKNEKILMYLKNDSAIHFTNIDLLELESDPFLLKVIPLRGKVKSFKVTSNLMLEHCFSSFFKY